MTRFNRDFRVLFFEELIESAESSPARLEWHQSPQGVEVITPHLSRELTVDERDIELRRLLEELIARCGAPAVAWYYTPMMLPFSRQISADCTVYDCMDELANFRFAPTQLLELEEELLDRADLVFTGGYSLYEAKREVHGNVYPFPSSVDRAHFIKARAVGSDPDDQIDLPSPRLGYFGVIDERFDTGLLAAIADARPNWCLIMVGPVVKIAHEDLPRRANIHYLGGKTYDELPSYLGGWDVALMPFAINDATRFISPTKTPEYLAGGKPVVSTPITDVKRHYGDIQAVAIAATPAEFVEACDKALALAWSADKEWLAEVDAMLSTQSWDVTQARMAGLVEAVLVAAEPTDPVAVAAS